MSCHKQDGAVKKNGGHLDFLACYIIPLLTNHWALLSIMQLAGLVTNPYPWSSKLSYSKFTRLCFEFPVRLTYSGIKTILWDIIQHVISF